MNKFISNYVSQQLGDGTRKVQQSSDPAKTIERGSVDKGMGVKKSGLKPIKGGSRQTKGGKMIRYGEDGRWEWEGADAKWAFENPNEAQKEFDGFLGSIGVQTGKHKAYTSDYTPKKNDQEEVIEEPQYMAIPSEEPNVHRKFKGVVNIVCDNGECKAKETDSGTADKIDSIYNEPGKAQGMARVHGGLPAQFKLNVKPDGSANFTDQQGHTGMKYYDPATYTGKEPTSHGLAADVLLKGQINRGLSDGSLTEEALYGAMTGKMRGNDLQQFQKQYPDAQAFKNGAFEDVVPQQDTPSVALRNSSKVDAKTLHDNYSLEQLLNSRLIKKGASRNKLKDEQSDVGKSYLNYRMQPGRARPVPEGIYKDINK